MWRTEWRIPCSKRSTDPKRCVGSTTPSWPRSREEIRDVLIDAVSVNGGHLGSNLGAVELTLALHRVFDSPRDAIVWDTGHQSYVHKLVTGRLDGFSRLRQGGGMSGYPSRAESEHDLVENSHASTAVSYAYGLAVARDAAPATTARHVDRGHRRRRAHRRARLRGAQQLRCTAVGAR